MNSFYLLHRKQYHHGRTLSSLLVVRHFQLLDYIYQVEEPLYDDKGNPVVENGVQQVEKKEYVHGGIAFYGGGKNYSTILNTEESMNELGLNHLKDISLTGLISSFSGNEPFNFYMYDKFSEVTPHSSPNINDLREFYYENN